MSPTVWGLTFKAMWLDPKPYRIFSRQLGEAHHFLALAGKGRVLPGRLQMSQTQTVILKTSPPGLEINFQPGLHLGVLWILVKYLELIF